MRYINAHVNSNCGVVRYPVMFKYDILTEKWIGGTVCITVQLAARLA